MRIKWTNCDITLLLILTFAFQMFSSSCLQFKWRETLNLYLTLIFFLRIWAMEGRALTWMMSSFTFSISWSILLCFETSTFWQKWWLQELLFSWSQNKDIFSALMMELGLLTASCGQTKQKTQKMTSNKSSSIRWSQELLSAALECLSFIMEKSKWMFERYVLSMSKTRIFFQIIPKQSWLKPDFSTLFKLLPRTFIWILFSQ